MDFKCFVCLWLRFIKTASVHFSCISGDWKYLRSTNVTLLQSENYQKCVNFIKSSENSVLQLVKKKQTFWFNCVWQVFYCSDESAALWRVRKILANSCWQDNKLCSSRLCFAWFLRMDTKVQCVFLQRVIAAPSLLQVSIFTLTTRQKSQKARGKCNSHAPTAVN